MRVWRLSGARQPHPAPGRRRLRPRRPPPYGRIPAPTPVGNQLRHAARLISAYAYLTGGRTLTPSCSWSSSPPSPRPSPSGASPSSAPPRPPPRCTPLGTCAPPPGTRQARRTHHTTGTETSPAPPGHRRRTGPAQLPTLPGLAVPDQASPDPDLTIRRRCDGHRHHGHADPPANRAARYPSGQTGPPARAGRLASLSTGWLGSLSLMPHLGGKTGRSASGVGVNLAFIRLRALASSGAASRQYLSVRRQALAVNGVQRPSPQPAERQAEAGELLVLPFGHPQPISAGVYCPGRRSTS